MAVPQSPQNLNEGVFSAPHCGHLAESADPHPPQNFFPAGFSDPHFEQRISAFPPPDERFEDGVNQAGQYQHEEAVQ
jgi:hypothetical protein